MIMQADILNSLTTTPPDFSLADAERVARRQFGIVGRAKLLVSDKDQNFCLEANDGSCLYIENFQSCRTPADS